MITVDNFLSNPCRVRRQALSADFIDWLGPDGQVYKRIAHADVPGLQEAIENAVGAVEMLGMGYRLNFGGEMPNAAIHTDFGWGTHACVLYLSHGAGGTAFWRHKETGAETIGQGDFDLMHAVDGDWDDETKWDMTDLAELKFNRGVIYDSSRFHSRYPFGAFGTSEQDGRLIAVAFFNK